MATSNNTIKIEILDSMVANLPSGHITEAKKYIIIHPEGGATISFNFLDKELHPIVTNAISDYCKQNKCSEIEKETYMNKYFIHVMQIMKKRVLVM